MMGGDITASSTPGVGTTFTVVLPAQVRASGVGAALGDEAAVGTGTAGSALVIDDDPAARELLARMLVRDGFRVRVAASGEEGLELARAERPDAITLDVLMPGMDGWGVLQALKADPELRDIPVVMVTLTDERSLGFALGAAAYLTKPIERTELSAVLARYRLDGGERVLVVEDDADARSVLRHVLEKEGWTVAEAGNGREGLAEVAASRPALVLLDLLMPEMDGFEFLEALRGDPITSSVPVVVITGKTLTAEDRRRLNGGVERVLEKGGWDAAAVVAQVRTVVARRS